MTEGDSFITPPRQVGELTTINPQEVHPGPKLRPELDPLLALWARRLFERVGHYIVPTPEKWEEGFLYDAQPQSELFVFEAIARAYEAFLAEHPDCDRERVASDLALISMLAPLKEETETAKKLRALYRRIWESMISDIETTRRDVFRSLAD